MVRRAVPEARERAQVRAVPPEVLEQVQTAARVVCIMRGWCRSRGSDAGAGVIVLKTLVEVFVVHREMREGAEGAQAGQECSLLVFFFSGSVILLRGWDVLGLRYVQ